MTESVQQPPAGETAWVAEFGEIDGVDLWPRARADAKDAESRLRRLRAVDVPPAWRPQFAESRGLRVLFDGMLSNRDELARTLAWERAGLPSEADLVLAAYAAWGEDTWSRIKGYFAVLVWDGIKDQLLCVRDPLGAQPLFFVETSNRLIASPCIHTLRSHPCVATDLNRPGLVDYLARRWTNGDETYFERIRRLLPGHVLRADSCGSRMERYWDPLPADGEIEWVPDDEVQNRFDALLERAVSSAMHGEPAGVFLSGGLDSAMIATLAADQCSRSGIPFPQAFSFVFPPPFDERIVQAGVAQQLGLAHQVLDFDEALPAGSVLASGISLSATLPAPLHNVWAPIYQRLSHAAASAGCRVMLTGEGADEWLGVSPYLAADLLRNADFRNLYHLWRTYARYYPGVRWASLPILLTTYALGPLIDQHPSIARIARSAKRIGRHGARVTATAGSGARLVPEPWIAADPALLAAISDRHEDRHARAESARHDSIYAASVRSRLRGTTQCLRAEESFVFGRRNRLPIRDPFWTTELIEFLIRVRPLSRQRNGVAKALIRNPLEKRFPDLGFGQQQKKVIGLLIRSIAPAETDEALRSLGRHWVLDDLGVIDSKQVLQNIDALQGTKAWRIWDLLNLESWVRAHA